MVLLLQRVCSVLCPSVFYGWTVVILVGLGMSCASPGHSFFFLNFVDSFISIGIPRTTVASLWSTCLVCAACTAPIGGNLIDRLGPRRVLLVVSVPFCMAVAALGLVQSAPRSDPDGSTLLSTKSSTAGGRRNVGVQRLSLECFTTVRYCLCRPLEQ